MLDIIYNNTVGYIFIHKTKKNPQPYIYKHGVTKEMVDELASKPLNYKITQRPFEENRILSFDGNTVHVDFMNLGKRFSTMNFKDICKLHDDLIRVLNNEQVYYCQFCHVIDIVSSLVLETEHHKCQCHVGHYDKFFWDHSSFNPITYSKLPKSIKEWERDSIDKMYHGRRQPFSKTDIKTHYILEKLYPTMATELGIEKYNGGYRNKFFN